MNNTMKMKLDRGISMSLCIPLKNNYTTLYGLKDILNAWKTVFGFILEHIENDLSPNWLTNQKDQGLCQLTFGTRSLITDID